MGEESILGRVLFMQIMCIVTMPRTFVGRNIYPGHNIRESICVVVFVCMWQSQITTLFIRHEVNNLKVDLTLPPYMLCRGLLSIVNDVCGNNSTIYPKISTQKNFLSV